jgi:uncharacterized protein YbbK (DUF523 family)
MHKHSRNEILQRWREEGRVISICPEVAGGLPIPRFIYDGSCTGTRIPGKGVTSSLLESSGVKVFSEDQFVEANDFLLELEAGGVL